MPLRKSSISVVLSAISATLPATGTPLDQVAAVPQSTVVPGVTAFSVSLVADVVMKVLPPVLVTVKPSLPRLLSSASDSVKLSAPSTVLPWLRVSVSLS